MSMTTESNEHANRTSPAERDADELTDCELERVSGGTGGSGNIRRPL
jgi:bacteriocin-like protein